MFMVERKKVRRQDLLSLPARGIKMVDVFRRLLKRVLSSVVRLSVS
jgi:hypothetical protein